MLDVACVCVGDKYTPELHVKQLYTALHKHLQQPFQFNVITDCPDHSFYKTIDCRIIPTPDLAIQVYKPWWCINPIFSAKYLKNKCYTLT